MEGGGEAGVAPVAIERTSSAFGPSLSAAAKEAPLTKKERQVVNSAAVEASDAAQRKKAAAQKVNQKALLKEVRGNQRQRNKGRAQPTRDPSKSPGSDRRAHDQGKATNQMRRNTAVSHVPQASRDVSTKIELNNPVPERQSSEGWTTVGAPAPVRASGVSMGNVRSWDAAKNFGFISWKGKDLYFKAEDIVNVSKV